MADTATYKRYSEKVRIFNGLKPEEVGEILHTGHTLEYSKGQTIFHEGMLGSNLFIVLSGEIGLYKTNRLIAVCKVGDAFGEMSVLNHRPRTATAAAETDVKLFTLDESQVNRILEKRVAVRLLLNVVHVLSERLEEANTWIADIRGRGKKEASKD